MVEREGFEALCKLLTTKLVEPEKFLGFPNRTPNEDGLARLRRPAVYQTG